MLEEEIENVDRILEALRNPFNESNIATNGIRSYKVGMTFLPRSRFEDAVNSPRPSALSLPILPPWTHSMYLILLLNNFTTAILIAILLYLNRSNFGESMARAHLSILAKLLFAREQAVPYNSR